MSLLADLQTMRLQTDLANSDASVSEANAVRLRSKSSVLQVSSDGGTFTAIPTIELTGAIYLDDPRFGGDPGASDNSAALAAAVAFLKSSGGGTLVCGPYNYNFTSTVTATTIKNIRITGAGGLPSINSGQVTSFTWNGAANGTMLRIEGADTLEIANIKFDGNGTADYGVDIYADATVGLTRKVSLLSCSIIGFRGTLGRGIRVGSSTNYQCSECEFHNLFFYRNRTNVYQYGTQTLNNVYSHIISANALAYDFYFEHGNISLQDIDFQAEEATHVACVYKADTAGYARFLRCYMELYYGKGYYAPSSTSNPNYASWVQCHGQANNTGLYLIDWQQGGTVFAGAGCRWLCSDAGYTAKVSWNAASGGTPGIVIDLSEYVTGASQEVLGSNTCLVGGGYVGSFPSGINPTASNIDSRTHAGEFAPYYYTLDYAIARRIHEGYFALSDRHSGSVQSMRMRTLSGTLHWRNGSDTSLMKLSQTGLLELVGSTPAIDFGVRHESGSAAPASGTYAQGDIVRNTGATAGGRVGWVCTAGGTPGTWKAFGPIDP